MENKNELVSKENSIIKAENKDNVYSSMNCETMEEKKILYNALNSCDALVKDVVGSEINLKDFYIERYEKMDDKTGELKPKYRTILFDDEGKSYATGSYGIFNSIQKLILAFGLPNTWKEPIKVKVEELKTKTGGNSLILTIM